MSTTPASASPAQMRAYISDMLSELAELAKLMRDTRLECSMRLLAVEVLTMAKGRDGRPPDGG